MTEITGNYGIHSGKENVHWTGNGETNSWSDPNNWENGKVPNVDSSNSGSINNWSTDGSVFHAVVDSAIAAQFVSLEVGPSSELAVIARNPIGKDFGYVFATQGFEIYGNSTMVINTPDRVQLGGVSKIDEGSTLTIMNNNGNVEIDNQHLSGSGNLNLVNSTLGNISSPVSIDNSMIVTLQNNSTLYTNTGSAGGSIVFDPSTLNTVILSGGNSTVTTKFEGLSSNSRIDIEGNNKIISTKIVHNADGTDSLHLMESNGKTININNISFAEGFDPTGIKIVNDGSGGQLIEFKGHGVITPSDVFQNIVSKSDSIIGTSTPTYSDPYMQHNHTVTNRWTGAASNGNWYDTDNWSNGTVPQATPDSEAVIDGNSDGTPLLVNADTPSYSQITSMGVGSNVVLSINATGPEGEVVFSTQGFELFDGGKININTSSKVELGGVSILRGDSSQINIKGNHGNVIFDNGGISGVGQINLDNSWIGSVSNPISFGNNNVTLTNGSQLFTSFRGVNGTISVDPNTTNTIFFTADEGYSDSPYSVNIEGVSSKTIFGIEPSSDRVPESASWSKNDDGSFTLTVKETGNHSVTLDNIHFSNGYSPSQMTIVPQTNGSWLVEPTSPGIVYVWNGPDHGGDPNVASNWLVNGLPAVESPSGNVTEVFNNGHDVQLKTDTPFSFGTLIVTGKTSLSLTSGNTSAIKTVIDPNSAIYGTAPDGPISLGELHNRGKIVSSADLNIGRVTNYYNGTISAQNGLVVGYYDTNRGIIEVWGDFDISGHEIKSSYEGRHDGYIKDDYVIDSHGAHRGKTIYHHCPYTCFHADTRFVVKNDNSDMEIKKIVNLKEGDLIPGTGTVSWVGRQLLPAGSRMIKINSLVVTPDHLIYTNGEFVPAEELPNTTIVVTQEDSYVYHLQVKEGHAIVNAQGVAADTLMYDPSRPEMETVFGVLDKTPAKWGINTAAPLRQLAMV
mgnify:FL=1